MQVMGSDPSPPLIRKLFESYRCTRLISQWVHATEGGTKINAGAVLTALRVHSALVLMALCLVTFGGAADVISTCLFEGMKHLSSWSSAALAHEGMCVPPVAALETVVGRCLATLLSPSQHVPPFPLPACPTTVMMVPDPRDCSRQNMTVRIDAQCVPGVEQALSKH